MKNVNLLLFLLAILLAATTLNADIYQWTDKNGVRYFGNQPPPEYAEDAKLIFKEDETSGAEVQKQTQPQQHESDNLMQENQTDQHESDNLMQENQTDEQRTDAVSPNDQQVPEQNKQLSREERIQAEKESLEKQIADLEEKPLSYFGSAKNKRARIGFYRYRLETLLHNPDEYFKHPQAFQGNVIEPEDKQAPAEEANPASTKTPTQ
jgi:flagella basal body P-ring formation protein FlgA